MTAGYSTRALAIHKSLPVVDGHNDLPWKLRTTPGDHDPGQHLEGFHTDIPRLLAGGVGAQLWSVYVPADIANPFQTTLEQIDLVERLVGAHDELAMARTGAEAREIRDSGKIASLIGAEGGHSIENSLDNLEVLSDRGVRYMTLTHSDTNEWADSATDDAVHGGLSGFGKDVVREMNRLGVLVDISHVSEETMRVALDVSQKPVIASHSNTYKLAPHPRNIPDDVLNEVGDRGGVVMAVFFSGFTVPEAANQALAMFEVYRAKPPTGRPLRRGCHGLQSCRRHPLWVPVRTCHPDHRTNPARAYGRCPKGDGNAARDRSRLHHGVLGPIHVDRGATRDDRFFAARVGAGLLARQRTSLTGMSRHLIID